MGEDRYEYLYRPLLERSVENYLVQHLARNYDFGKESRVASLLVRKTVQILPCHCLPQNI
jgi:hypothetical protein